MPALSITQNIYNFTWTVNLKLLGIEPITPNSTGTFTYSVSPALLDGLTLNTSTGAIYGSTSVLTTGTEYTMGVVNHLGSSTSAVFTLTTVYATMRPVVDTAYRTLIQNRAMARFKPIDAYGGTGTLTWSISPSLPAGISMSSTGTITGTPLDLLSTTTYYVTVVDEAISSVNKSFKLNVISSNTDLVQPGDIVHVADFNSIQSAINSITGIGTLGYGVSSYASLPVTNQNKITAAGWISLIRDINVAYGHINNSRGIDPTLITTSTRVGARLTNTLNDAIAYMDANRYTCNPWQYYSDPTTGGSTNYGRTEHDGRSLRTTTWGFGTQTQITHVVEANWFTGLLADYFFNQSAYFTWSPSWAGTVTNDLDLEWVNFINYIQHRGGYEYRREQYVNYISTLTTYNSGTLSISVLAEKSEIPDAQGEIQNLVRFTITYGNSYNPDFVVVPPNGWWNFVI